MLPADKAYAADDEYTYTITVNSGKEDMYINSADGMDKLSQADPEKFKTSDPDELKEAFKELGKKE